jgi:hypothetical protein
MLGVGAFIYGVAISVTFSMCARNRQLSRPHSPLLFGLGYVLCGVSIGVCTSLTLVAITGDVGAGSMIPLVDGLVAAVESPHLI